MAKAKMRQNVLGRFTRLERLAAVLAEIDAKLRVGTPLTKQDVALCSFGSRHFQFLKDARAWKSDAETSTHHLSTLENARRLESASTGEVSMASSPDA